MYQGDSKTIKVFAMNEKNIKNDSKELYFDLNEKKINLVQKTYYICNDVESPDSKKRIFAKIDLNELIKSTIFANISSESVQKCVESDFAFYGSGYQSWGFGGEIESGKYQKKYIPLVPQFKKYVEMPGKNAISDFCSKKLLIGQFLIYFRWKNLYLVVASTGNMNNRCVPPVEFYINRKERILNCAVDSVGKKWKSNEIISELTFFAAENFFELKDIVQKLYKDEVDGKSRFSHYEELSVYKNRIVAGGWESWYNHYSFINEELIIEDLNSLQKSQNIINSFINPKTKNTIFQVDDGWEKAAGFWDYDANRFPNGMTNLATKISEKGYIPGLWVAPFIIDYRSDFCKNHRNWLLRNKRNKPVFAGYNPLWGASFGVEQPSLPNSFFCLDMSIESVQEYLDSLMEKIINEWGFRYIKLDFLYAGMLVGKNQNDGPAYLWYKKAIEILTSRKKNKNGDDIFYLGCRMPFELSYNSLPLSRIGPDTKEDWDVPLMAKMNFSGRTSAFKNLQSTLGHAFWNEGIFINDPDVVFLRDENISLDEVERELILLVNFLFASQIMHSDDPSRFNEDKEGEFTKRIISLFDLFANEEFGMINICSNSYFICSRTKKFYGIINLNDNPKEFSAKEMISIWGDDFKSMVLSPIVNHTNVNGKIVVDKNEKIKAEKHSISVFQID